MTSKPHWWKQNGELLTLIGIIVGVVIGLIVLGLAAYRFHWDWTGLNDFVTPLIPISPRYQPQQYQRGKTLWDWMQLFIIPIVLACIAFLFSRVANKNEQKASERRAKTELEIALSSQHEGSLQLYLDRMTELLLKEQLIKSGLFDEVRNIARARTLTVLSELDAARKRSLLQFLQEAGLIRNNKTANGTIVKLKGANLQGTDLSNTDLSGADLSDTDLSNANLNGADLSNTDLAGAILRRTNLIKATLRGTNLSRAELHEIALRGANLSRAQLQDVSLVGADLRSANLQEATLSNAILRNAYLGGANLSQANLSNADLSEVNLSDDSIGIANLRRVNRNLGEQRKLFYRVIFYLNITDRLKLRIAQVRGANLNSANLSGANLSGAYLSQVNLRGANLLGAKVTTEQLNAAKSLKGAIMPDGSIHP